MSVVAADVESPFEDPREVSASDGQRPIADVSLAAMSRLRTPFEVAEDDALPGNHTDRR